MSLIGSYPSPLGGLIMLSDGKSLTGLYFPRERGFNNVEAFKQKHDEAKVFKETRTWLDIYFEGKDPDFLPDLLLLGTEFQKEVWKILLTIGHGETKTYGQVASIIAKERSINRMSAQAVGGAVGANPISIIVPCHRVLGAGGRLTGYAGGLENKKWLLELEGIKMKQ